MKPGLCQRAFKVRFYFGADPKRVSSFNFDKTARIEGTLLGIKGQYVILDTGVLNMRKFAGYSVTLTV
jgi:Protein of unknown function (DUF2797)